MEAGLNELPVTVGYPRGQDQPRRFRLARMLVVLAVCGCSDSGMDSRGMADLAVDLDAPGGEIDPTNTTFNVTEGSYFNYELAVFGNEDFGTNSVIGSTVHNPFLMEQLLDASIDAVLDTYFP